MVAVVAVVKQLLVLAVLAALVAVLDIPEEVPLLDKVFQGKVMRVGYHRRLLVDRSRKVAVVVLVLLDCHLWLLLLAAMAVQE
jgi:hypothetical protein